MRAILAADKNWGIGLNNQLLISIPADMRFFRKKTVGQVVIMGRKTLESMPNGKPLADRINIVMSRDPNLLVPGAAVVSSAAEAVAEAARFKDRKVYVIGGGQVYRELLPYCDTAYVTRIDYAYQADTYFPNLDEDPAWELERESEEQTYFDVEYTFRKYVRKTIA